MSMGWCDQFENLIANVLTSLYGFAIVFCAMYFWLIGNEELKGSRHHAMGGDTPLFSVCLIQDELRAR